MRRERRPLRLERRQERRLPGAGATIGDRLKESGGCSCPGLPAALFLLPEEPGVRFLPGAFKPASASAAEPRPEGKRGGIGALKGEKGLGDAQAALPARDFLVLWVF